MSSCSDDDEAGSGAITDGTGGAEFLIGTWQLTNIRYDDGSDIDDCEKNSTLEITTTEAIYVGFNEFSENECSAGLEVTSEYTVEGNEIEATFISRIRGSNAKTTYTATSNSLTIVKTESIFNGLNGDEEEEKVEISLKKM
ncbi:lipocalin family protein [Aquimarina agarivorans]|uniref:lipocalin family protein n=1 Tax=Aquimarina agarivorans TaxID=980584 RepID=UPI000248EB70|nr:lipocalin family protein [Aquimarina agarivorans]